MTGILASPFFTADTDVTAAVSEAAVWGEGDAGPPTLVVGVEEDRVEASEEEVEAGFYMDNLDPVSDVEVTHTSPPLYNVTGGYSPSGYFYDPRDVEPDD